MIPNFTMWADGRAVYSTADLIIRKAQIAFDDVDALAALAVELFEMEDSYVGISMVPLIPTMFTIVTTQGRKTVSVSGLPLDHALSGEQNPEIMEVLRSIWKQAASHMS
ncbi:MAG: hypothetical protein QF465_03305, partial [SAR202 cluster bacterium]|nr:hypothetical protein [SAR202 cluster bacterium]